MTAAGGSANATTIARTTAATSLTALQCDLRALFASRPTNRALAEALPRIGAHFGAVYTVVHTRLGGHVLSEEWAADAERFDVSDRGRINEALWESVSRRRPAASASRSARTRCC